MKTIFGLTGGSAAAVASGAASAKAAISDATAQVVAPRTPNFLQKRCVWVTVHFQSCNNLRWRDRIGDCPAPSACGQTDQAWAHLSAQESSDEPSQRLSLPPPVPRNVFARCRRF